MPEQTFFYRTGWRILPKKTAWRLVAQIPISNARFTRNRTKSERWMIWKFVSSKSTWQLIVTKTRWNATKMQWQCSIDGTSSTMMLWLYKQPAPASTLSLTSSSNLTAAHFNATLGINSEIIWTMNCVVKG